MHVFHTQDVMTVTQNCKPLDPKILNAAWELRCGPQNVFHVLYEVLEEEQQVNILVIGIKQGERVLLEQRHLAGLERLLMNGRELE
jgi:hypothetical protein